MIITRVRPSIYLGTCVCIWGVVSTCNAATHKFADLVVVRFFLGFVEAPFFPGAVFLVSLTTKSCADVGMILTFCFCVLDVVLVYSSRIDAKNRLVLFR